MFPDIVRQSLVLDGAIINAASIAVTIERKVEGLGAQVPIGVLASPPRGAPRVDSRLHLVFKILKTCSVRLEMRRPRI